MPPQATQRTACNRCRLQKVRCPRSDQSLPGEPCARCVRAHAACITSKARRVGRPRLTPLTTDTQQPVQKQKESLEWLAESSQQSTTSNGTETSTSAVDSLPPDGLESWTQGGQQSVPLDALGDGLIVHGDDGASPSAWTFFGEGTAANVNNIDATMSLDDQYPNLFDYAGTPKDTHVFLGEPGTVESAKEATVSADQVTDVYQASAGDNAQGHLQRGHGSSSLGYVDDSRDVLFVASPGRRLTGTSSLFVPNVLVELTRLSEGIARQMIQLPRFFTQGIPVNTACARELNSTRENPVSMLLQSTNDFIAILRRLGSAPFPASSIASRAQSSMAIPPPSTPIVLLMLSSYLQLLQLYDAIFSHVVYTLYNIRDLTGFFEDAPDYAIPGLPPVRGDLFVKIVIGIIEDRLAAAERLIGLPAELRLANSQALRGRQHDLGNNRDQGGHDVTGLLRQVPDAARLLQVIMAPTKVPTTSTGLHVEEKSGKALITSLRGSLDFVWNVVSVGST